MKIFDHDAEYNDEEWMQFATEAFKIDDEMRKNLEQFVNFTIGNPIKNMKYIPDDDIAYLDINKEEYHDQRSSHRILEQRQNPYRRRCIQRCV